MPVHADIQGDKGGNAVFFFIVFFARKRLNAEGAEVRRGTFSSLFRAYPVVTHTHYI